MIKSVYLKKSMESSDKTKVSIRLIIPAMLILLSLGSCAGNRWSEALQKEQIGELSEIISDMQEADALCPDSFDSDATVFWKTPVDDTGVRGYLQFLSPSFIKFIVSNPLGQPLYAFASDGKMFQALNTMHHQHTRGSIRALAIRKRLPQILAQGNWFAYLSGHLPSQHITIVEAHRDTSDESSIWLLPEHPKTSRTLDTTWIHLDTKRNMVLGYLFLDTNGKTLAEITYNDQLIGSDPCGPQHDITVTNLPWGSTIHIGLRDIKTDREYHETDFTLPVPAGYAKMLLP